MTLSIKEEDGFYIIIPAGKIIGGPDAIELKEEITKALNGKHKPKKIIIDMKNTNWMNSDAMGMFIEADKDTQDENVDLVFINVSDRVENLFKITKLQGKFKFFKSLIDAKLG